MGGTGGNVPKLMDYHNLSRMAEFCATKGDYEAAIDYYKRMTEILPENGPSWTALGHCYLLTEESHSAFNAYQHALYSLDDIKDPQLWYGIGILYEKFESYEHAISALIAVLKMSPNFYQKSEVLFKLGTIFAKTN
jgi:tetratricopeptide (TPR) repeat protein